jgi:hypothetical protein
MGSGLKIYIQDKLIKALVERQIMSSRHAKVDW